MTNYVKVNANIQYLLHYNVYRVCNRVHVRSPLLKVKVYVQNESLSERIYIRFEIFEARLAFRCPLKPETLKLPVWVRTWLTRHLQSHLPRVKNSDIK